MKNEYKAPQMELIPVSVSDIIVTSGGFAGVEDKFPTPTFMSNP